VLERSLVVGNHESGAFHFRSLSKQPVLSCQGSTAMALSRSMFCGQHGPSFLVEFLNHHLNSDPNGLKVAGFRSRNCNCGAFRPAIAMDNPALDRGNGREPGHACSLSDSMRPSTGLSSITTFTVFLGSNPSDCRNSISSFYMGKYGTQWRDTKSTRSRSASIPEKGINALHDAAYQARLFQECLAKGEGRQR